MTSPCALNWTQQIEGGGTGQERDGNAIAFGFSVGRLHTHCKVARYAHGTTKGHHGIKLL